MKRIFPLTLFLALAVAGPAAAAEPVPAEPGPYGGDAPYEGDNPYEEDEPYEGAEPGVYGGADPYDGDSPYERGRILRGYVVSAGRVDPTENIGTGFFVDVNASSVMLNGGVATKRFGETPIRPSTTDDEFEADGEQVTNAYLGVGFSRILQFQYGHGNHGGLLRLRSDFNLRAIMDFLSGNPTPKDRLLLGDRLTFTVSAESYQDSDEEIFDNATWGIGLLF